MKPKNRTAVHLIPGMACVAAMLWLVATTNVQAQYNYATLSVPGAENTKAEGIDGSDIVGYYDEGSSDEGFF